MIHKQKRMIAALNPIDSKVGINPIAPVPRAMPLSVTRNVGFGSVTERDTAVCVLPGTELAFVSEVRLADWTIRSLIRGRFRVRERSLTQPTAMH
jgi:hypothetical protein